MNIDIDDMSMSNGSTGYLGIIDEETNKYVDNTDTNDFYLDFTLYYSNSKIKSTFKSRLIKRFKTNIKNITEKQTNFDMSIDNINFKYYFIGVKLIKIDKRYILRKFGGQLIMKSILYKK